MEQVPKPGHIRERTSSRGATRMRFRAAGASVYSVERRRVYECEGAQGGGGSTRGAVSALDCAACNAAEKKRKKPIEQQLAEMRAKGYL